MQSSEFVALAVMVGLLLVGFALSLLWNRWFHDNHTMAIHAERRRRYRSQALALLYVAAFMAVNVSVRSGWLSDRLLVILGIAIASLLGIGTIWAYYRWLREADELVRKIEIDALALAFGLGIVGIMAAAQLARAEIVPEVSVHRALLVMFLTYAVTRFVGHRRYR